MAPSSPPGQQQVGQDAAASSPPAGSSVPAGIVPNAAMDGSWLATCVEERQLGEGAFGTVHQVLVTLPSGRTFRAARKRMPAGPITAIMQAAEVEALRVGAGCPHLVQLLDVRSTDGHHEVLLELATGGTVEEELATSVQVHGRPLNDDRIRDIAASCLHGLVFLHRRGVCIRDIKPENLLVRSPGGQVILADLGHATRSDSGGRLHQQGWEGTILYIAPEAAPGVLCQRPVQRQQQPGSRLSSGCQRVGGAKAAKRPVLTTKVDVFALGKSLYRCAGWRCPLKDWEAGISTELRQFLDHLMEPNAAKRPTAAASLPAAAAAGVSSQRLTRETMGSGREGWKSGRGRAVSTVQ